MAKMLSMVDVCKSHGRRNSRIQSLKGISLTVASGDIVGIVGSQNGGGTTLLQVAAGRIKPDTGQIRLGDTDLTSLSRRRRQALTSRHVLWIDRRPRPSDSMWTAQRYLRMTVWADTKLDRHEVTRRAERGLDRVDASGFDQGELTLVSKMSSGDRKIVALETSAGRLSDSFLYVPTGVGLTEHDYADPSFSSMRRSAPTRLKCLRATSPVETCDLCLPGQSSMKPSSKTTGKELAQVRHCCRSSPCDDRSDSRHNGR
jgi:ABC-type lipoprotein export system ATPase subunit